MSDPAAYALASLLDWVLKGFLIFALALSVDLLLRRASAQLRHIVWITSLASAILLPVLSLALPSLDAPLFSLGVFAPPAAGQADAAAPGDSLSLNAYQILVIIYIAGALLVLMWQLVGRIYAVRLRRRASRITDSGLLCELRRLRFALGIRKDIELLSSSMVRIPFSAGFFRPAVILPDTWRSWPRSVFESVLIHELGHIRRRDCLTRIAAQLCCCIHWIDPLAWFGLGRVIMEQEIACDNLVLERGTKPSAYARSLLALAKTRSDGLQFAMTTLGRRAELQNRLLEILRPKRSRTSLPIRSSLTFIVLAFGLILPISALNVWKEPKPGASGTRTGVVSQFQAKLTHETFPGTTNQAKAVTKALPMPEFNKDYVAKQIQKMKAEGVPEAKISVFMEKAKAKLADIEMQKKLAEQEKIKTPSRPETDQIRR